MKTLLRYVLSRYSYKYKEEYAHEIFQGTSIVWLNPSDIVPENSTDDIVLDEIHLYGGATLAFVRPDDPKYVLHIFKCYFSCMILCSLLFLSQVSHKYSCRNYVR